MKINSFKAENVHDYLKFDINFFPDLTFLIGINGSGKTSALKLILGLTSPSYQYLNQVNYKYCEVVCSSINDEKNIIIRAEQNIKDNTFFIKLRINENEYNSTSIKRFFRAENNQYDIDEITQIEQRNKELFDELEVTKKIRELATPKFLGLDRRIYEGINSDFRYRNRRVISNSKYRNKRYDGFPEPQAIDISLEEVQILVFDYIRQIPQQQFQISDDFKVKLFRESFKFYQDFSVKEIPTTKEIIDRKEKVLKAIEDLGIKYLNYSINDFFSKIEDITNKYENLKEDEKDFKSNKYIEIINAWYLNGNQIKRIDDIISYSQEYHQKIIELRSPLKKLEEITSNFLKENSKMLHIEADGEIKIKLKNGNDANIYELSSGEKQIIIMIAHLIFEEAQKTSGVFIIDEPELSLHIAWQEIFVQSIMAASSKTQFILATHSPSIVAKVEKEKYCQDMNKLNF